VKGTMDFYDKTAPEWAERGYEAEPEIPALLDFAKQFPRGSRFLDVCCGCGCESWRIHSNLSENVKFSDIFYIIESLMWLQKAIFDNKKGAFPSDFR